MLVLARKAGQSITAASVKITIVEIRGKVVRVGLSAPREIPIMRDELLTAGDDAEPLDLVEV